MAPLNTTGDASSPLLPASNSSAVANETTITTRDPHWPDHSTGSTDYTREIDHKTTAAAVIGSVILAIVLAIIFYRCLQRALVGPDVDPALAMPRGHVYGHDNASAHEMRPMRSGSSYGRPAVREIEDRAAGSGGSTPAVARPTRAVTHPWDEQGTPPPPPPYLAPPKYRL